MKVPDEIKVSLATVVAIFSMTIAGRIYNIDFSFTENYGPIWLFLLYVMVKSQPSTNSRQKKPIYWSVLILGLTATIILFNIFF